MIVWDLADRRNFFAIGLCLKLELSESWLSAFPASSLADYVRAYSKSVYPAVAKYEGL